MRSSRRYCWNTKAKANSTGLMDEDYSGSFYKTKKMAVNIEKTVDYADYYLNYYGYPYDTINGCRAPLTPAGSSAPKSSRNSLNRILGQVFAICSFFFLNR